MWIARDKDGRLGLYSLKPKLNEADGTWFCEQDNPIFEDDYDHTWDAQRLNENCYPEVTFENSPVELKLDM